MAELKRTLGLGQCIFFGVGSILGAGIYTIVGKVAGWSGNMLWLSFILASVTALFTVFSYAELSAAYPRSGGEYEYAKKAFGKNMGILVGGIQYQPIATEESRRKSGVADQFDYSCSRCAES